MPYLPPGMNLRPARPEELPPGFEPRVEAVLNWRDALKWLNKHWGKEFGVREGAGRKIITNNGREYAAAETWEQAIQRGFERRLAEAKLI